ncbi:phosphoribosyl-ATP diphosphatase [Thermoproteota archaeon]
MVEFIKQLESILKQRKKERPEGSYSAKLFEQGSDRILRKIGEEAGELIIAAKNDDSSEIKNEMADLLFHMIVLLVHSNISVDDLMAVLKNRHK